MRELQRLDRMRRQTPHRDASRAYRDEENSTKFFLFASSRKTGGSVRLTSRTDLTVSTHQLDSSSRSYTGKDISIAITDYLTVIEVVAP